MDLRNNVKDQREYLSRNLAQINGVVSALLGVKVNFVVSERSKVMVEDGNNYRDCCGMLKSQYRDVELVCNPFGIFWKEDGVNFQLDLILHPVARNRKTLDTCLCDIAIINDVVYIVG